MWKQREGRTRAFYCIRDVRKGLMVCAGVRASISSPEGRRPPGGQHPAFLTALGSSARAQLASPHITRRMKGRAKLQPLQGYSAVGRKRMVGPFHRQEKRASGGEVTCPRPEAGGSLGPRKEGFLLCGTKPVLTGCFTLVHLTKNRRLAF